MKQVSRLNELSFNAIHIGTEADNIQGIKSGQYQFVFGSPGLLDGTSNGELVLPKQPSINCY